MQSGEVSTLVTAPADLQFPSDIVVSPSGNSAYVADSGTNRVVSIDIETGTLSTLVENPSSEPPGCKTEANLTSDSTSARRLWR